MDYIQPCKKYKYFVATDTGEMPTPHKYEYESVLNDLKICRKGWSDKKWMVYRLVYVQSTRRSGKKEYLFDRVDVEVEKNMWQESIATSVIVDEINCVYSAKAVKARGSA